MKELCVMIIISALLVILAVFVAALLRTDPQTPGAILRTESQEWRSLKDTVRLQGNSIQEAWKNEQRMSDRIFELEKDRIEREIPKRK